MKRILLSVFAVAITAAWAVPATAGDVTFGGQYRLRGEYRNNYDSSSTATTTDFSDAAADDDDKDSWTQRVRLTANANATDDTSVKVTIQDTRTFGGTSLLSDSGANMLDLHEAYVNVANIFGTPVTARVGRQELAYGDQRLIGSFGWSNNGRAFDGFKFTYASDMVDVDVFSTTVVESGTTTSDDMFNGAYATIKQIIPDNNVDVYLLHYANNTYSTVPQSATIYTVGARVAGAMVGVDYTLEVPYQFGTISNGTSAGEHDLSAWAAAVKVGYTLPTPMKIRVGAEYDYATGEGDNTATASTTEINTFQNLFPTNHGHFGINDIVNSWSNISAWSVNASAAVNEQLSLMVAYWNFNQAVEEDQAGTAGLDGTALGSEVDLVAKYKYNSNVGIEAGFSRFMPDDAITGKGATIKQDDADWAYIQLTANF